MHSKSLKSLLGIVAVVGLSASGPCGSNTPDGGTGTSGGRSNGTSSSSSSGSSSSGGSGGLCGQWEGTNVDPCAQATCETGTDCPSGSAWTASPESCGLTAGGGTQYMQCCVAPLSIDPCALGGIGSCINYASSPYCPFGFTDVPSLQCPVGVVGANRSWACCIPFVDLPSVGLPACSLPSLYEGTPNDSCASGTSNCETGSSCPGTEVPVISSVCLEEGAAAGAPGSITDCCVPPLSVDPCASGGQGICGGSPGVPFYQEGCPSGLTIVPSATCDQCCLPLSDLPSVGLGSSSSGGTTSSGTSSSSSSGTSSSSSGSPGCTGSETYLGNVIFEEIDQAGSGLAVYSEDLLLACGAPATPTVCVALPGTCCYQGPEGASDGGAKDGGSKGPIAEPNAGVVTIDDNGALIGTETYNSMFNAYNALSSVPLETTVPEPGTYDPTLAWNPGDVLTVSTTGDSSSVAAITGSITVPPALAGVTIGGAGSPSATTLTPISVSQPLIVNWTPEPVGSVGFELTAEFPHLQSGTIYCTAFYDAGTLTVPQSMLANFAAGEDGGISLSPAVITTGTCANASVSVTVIPLSVAGQVTYTP